MTHSYIELSEFIDKGRNPGTHRTLGNNTVAVRRGDDIAVKLHATDVVTYHRDGTVTYDSGGWRTYTTKDRMSNYGPSSWTVSSTRGVWTLWRSSWSYGEDYAREFKYFDGMTIDPDKGELLNPWDGPDFEAIERERKRIDGLIRAYLRALTPETIIAAANDMGGDCLYCRASFGDSDHLVSHIEEVYVMGSLIANAYQAKRYRDYGFVLSMDYSGLSSEREETRKRSIKSIREHVGKYLRANLRDGSTIEDRLGGAVKRIGKVRALGKLPTGAEL